MKAHEYILSKQIEWARNHDIKLVGSKMREGRPTYASDLDCNLFQPLIPDVYERFLRGDGNEIISTEGRAAKMRALHSSSALAVNVFQYWQKINQVSVIAAACGFCREGNNTSQNIVFEDKYVIDARFQFSPNIDVVFHNSGSSQYKRFAIECKFSEAYGSRRHNGVDPKYINPGALWEDIPNTLELAKSLSPDDEEFTYLHPAQLIKHILALKTAFGKGGFRLLYLWYDVLGEEGAGHRREIETFSSIVNEDGVKLHSTTYQELIVKLSHRYRQDHRAYIGYLTERYL